MSSSLTTAISQAYTTDGFALGPQVLDQSQIQELREELDRVIADRDRPDCRQPVMLRHIGTGEAGRYIWQIVNIYEASEAFATVLFESELGSLAAELLNTPVVRIWHDQIQYKPSGKGGQNNWHQDGPYWPILQQNDQLTAWIALDDADEDNGCMHMVPGSHKWGDATATLHRSPDFDALPSQYQDHVVAPRPCPVPAGHVHFHHALTWHGSPANLSGRPRRAIAFHFMPNHNNFDASGNHVMKQFVEVADGEPLQGSHFPVVWPKD